MEVELISGSSTCVQRPDPDNFKLPQNDWVLDLGQVELG